MENRLKPVLSLAEWHRQNYTSDIPMMSKYQEWMNYRSKILADNRIVMARRKRMTESGLNKKRK